MNRQSKLAEKAKLVATSLGGWAKREKLLHPGEQLVFHLEIKSVATVVQGDVTTELRDVDPKHSIRVADRPNRSRPLIAPARLKAAEVSALLSYVKHERACHRALTILLVEQGNEPYAPSDEKIDWPGQPDLTEFGLFYYPNREIIRNLLKNFDLNGRHFHLQLGFGQNRAVQLWEVKPHR